MKANRKFRDADNAVSAVIGVILMVAITVAIAATVYVYVSGMIGGSQESTPNIQFTKDDTNDKLTVVTADQSLDWNNVKIANNSATAFVYVAQIDSDLTNGSYISAGDEINNLAGTVRVMWQPTNTLIVTYTFT